MAILHPMESVDNICIVTIVTNVTIVTIVTTVSFDPVLILDKWRPNWSRHLSGGNGVFPGNVTVLLDFGAV